MRGQEKVTVHELNVCFSRGVQPTQVRKIPPPNQTVEEAPAVVTQKRREATETPDGSKIIGGQKIAVVESSKRPNNLRIDTHKACPAQSAIAMET